MHPRTSHRALVALAIRAFACAFLLLALGACGTLTEHVLDTSAPPPVAWQDDASLRHAVDALAQPLVQGGETPGVVVGVLLPDGSQRFYGYGTVVRGAQVPPDGDTVFPVGSLSKGFLGALASLMVEDGSLHWDDTLGQLLPGAPLSPDARRITVQQLATHTSGLPRQPFTFRTFRYFVQFLFTGRNFYRHFDEDYVYDYLSDFSAPEKVEPQYSNIGYGLLGEVIERRTGLELDDLLDRELCRPLGLTHTGYVPEALPSLHAHGYAGDQPKFLPRGAPVPDWHFTELMKGSAGLYSSAHDLLTFAAAHMDGKHTRLSAALADNLRPRFWRHKDAPAVAWTVDEIGDQRITYQVGLVAGYTSYVGLDLEHHTAVVVLQNSFNWKDKIGHRLLTRLGAGQPQSEAQTSSHSLRM